MLARQLKKFLSDHRRNAVIQRFDKYLVGLHEAYENRNYDFQENGEKFVLQVVRGITPIHAVFDSNNRRLLLCR